MKTSQYQRVARRVSARKKFQGHAYTPGPEAGPRRNAGSDWDQTSDEIKRNSQTHGPSSRR